jgi:DnaJ-class molecular chaperone
MPGLERPRPSESGPNPERENLQPCAKCKGSGKIYENGQEKICDACGGTGYYRRRQQLAPLPVR